MESDEKPKQVGPIQPSMKSLGTIIEQMNKNTNPVNTSLLSLGRSHPRPSRAL